MPQSPPDQRPFVVDAVIRVCNGCGSEVTIPIDPPWRSAQEFIAWHKAGHIPRCDCGATTCDLKLHIADQN